LRTRTGKTGLLERIRKAGQVGENTKESTDFVKDHPSHERWTLGSQRKCRYKQDSSYVENKKNKKKKKKEKKEPLPVLVHLKSGWCTGMLLRIQAS